jgi:hypothetical protein
VPERDARGRITSHRGRASQLSKLRPGMSLFELQRMAGHKSILSTLYYLEAIQPTRLAHAFAKADKTSRMIEVLIDQEAVVSGAAARGEPWQYYDLGPAGFCANPFWAKCAHRMACPGCDFNVPKDSARGEAGMAKAGLQRYQQEVPLTDEEREVVEGDIAKLDVMLSRLQHIPTPDGRTPHEIEATGEHVRQPQRKSIPLPILRMSPRAD